MPATSISECQNQHKPLQHKPIETKMLNITIVRYWELIVLRNNKLRKMLMVNRQWYSFKARVKWMNLHILKTNTNHHLTIAALHSKTWTISFSRTRKLSKRIQVSKVISKSATLFWESRIGCTKESLITVDIETRIHFWALLIIRSSYQRQKWSRLQME